MRRKWINLLILAAVVLLAVVPLLTVSSKGDQERFAGADAQAEKLVTEIQPDYKPWFNSVWEPPSAEIESLLFALQASIGAGVIGYYFGVKRGQATRAGRVQANASD